MCHNRFVFKHVQTVWVLKDPHSTGTRIWPSAGDIASKVAKILLRLWAVVTLEVDCGNLRLGSGMSRMRLSILCNVR